MTRRPSKSTSAEAARWFLRSRSESENDRRAFFRWLRKNPHALEEYDAIESVWSELGELSGDPGLESELRVPAHRPRRYAPMLAAAAALLLAVVVGGAVALSAFNTPSAVIYASAHGERRTISLPDGSVLSLNADSRAEVRIGGSDREVRLLSGEAFFQVAKMHGAPFFVDASGERIRVVGTGFNVRLLNKGFRLDVVEGVVRLEGVEGAEFNAGQSTLVGARERVLRLSPIAATRAAAWRQGRLELEATPLGEAVEAMNHYSKRQLVFADPKLAALRVDGVFQLDDAETFAQGLRVLGLVKLVEQDDKILLAPPADVSPR